jgi:hypothetical protein
VAVVIAVVATIFSGYILGCGEGDSGLILPARDRAPL